MPELPQAALEAQFRQTLGDCQDLYLSAARDCTAQHPHLIPGSPQNFLQLMSDLHHGLLIKIFVTVASADQIWSPEEMLLSAILFEHIWGEPLEGERLREAAHHVIAQSNRLQWYACVRPFDQIPPLRERLGELETVVMRLANLVAKCDGSVTAAEAAMIKNVEQQILGQLRPLALEEPEPPPLAEPAGREAMQQMQADSTAIRQQYHLKKQPELATPGPPKPAEELLQEALRELNDLIGMPGIKQEVATLANFLRLQHQRRAAGLPATEVSLHMVFTGNPGTGKTSVARIVGKIFSAMGILKKGHLVETDRSGLVAEYAGQTGPKTNRKIDEALDGVLFIDEAYSLVAESSEDAYGREAVQTLLKRMEDERHRLVVILAGYPEPMENLLNSNPGLTSRFNTRLAFEDYRAGELGRIFQFLCDKNHYRVPGPTQARLLLAFRWLYDHRDERFGNGRLVRNTFENAIRRLANRIASIAPITAELLTVLEAVDIDLNGVPRELLAAASNEEQRFRVLCEGCGGKTDVTAAFLAQRVKCKACNHRFTSAWGEPVEE